MNELNLSSHSQKRIKSRVGINQKGIENYAAQAFDKGLRHSETRGALNKYITKTFFKNTYANNIRIYHHYVFIFSGFSLITVYSLPNNLCKIADKQTRQHDQDDTDGKLD